MTRRRRPSVGRAAWLGTLLLVGACGPTARNPPAASAPILLVGIDGLEWTVVLPLVRDGRMPHLSSLMERGVFGRLETIAPAKSPVIWTSIATGRRPAEHGIVDFFRQDDAGGRRLFGSADRRTKTLWNILSDFGLRSVVVSWWNTFPAEPIEGVVVAQANTLEQIARRRMLKPGGMLRGVAGQVYPPQRQDEMLAITEQVDAELPELLRRGFGDIDQAESLADRANVESCAWSLRADESTRRIALRLAAERPLPDLFAVYLGTPDVVSHRFWRFHEPEAFVHPPSSAEIEWFGGVIEDAYVHADSVLGELLAVLPEQTNVFVVSDHGMHAGHTASRFDVPVDGRLERESGGHEDGPAGLFVAAGPDIRRASTADGDELPRIGHALDLAPTLLALVGLPVGRDMDGAVLNGVLETAPVVTYVETHDSPEWLARRTGAAAPVPGAAERLEQFRSLGYIGGPSAEEETEP